MAKTDSYQRWIPKRFKYLMLGILALSINSGLQGTTQTIQIPSLAEAARRADQLAPKDLTQIEVDESIRDRLRFDPEWQPILQGVRRDIMVLKWGNGHLVNPAWKQYGPKVYPLLDYYTRSGDPVRAAYGMSGLRALGKPYTTLWLERQLQRHADSSNFSLVASYVEDDCTTEDCWEEVFGLKDSVTRDHLIQVARQNLKPKTSPDYEDQFNLAFLRSVGAEKDINPWGWDSPFDPDTIPELQKWLQLEKVRSPDASQVQVAINSYRMLPDEAQRYILLDRLGEVKAGDISPIGRAVLRSLAIDTKSKDRMWAIAELDRHGDSQGTKLLSEIVNGDLSQLYELTNSASEGDGGRYDYQHPMLLILAIAKKYPQSKFIRGCIEYGNLRGASYIGKLSRGKAIRNRNFLRAPAERVRDWQQWLSRYSDHPGADDATYFLAKSLQDENDFVGATRQLIRLMTQKPGDRDALELAWPHLRTYLDVGLSVEQLKVVLQEQHDTAIAPLLQYALAVRQARLQNYAEALSLTESLDLTKMPSDILGTYYSKWKGLGLPKPEEFQTRMQLMLVDQRQRWQTLHNMQIEHTPDSLYRIASHWTGYEGWKNGYLPFWEKKRVFQLPFLNPEVCKDYGVCNVNLRSQKQILSLYQNSSQNSIALSLYQKILSDSKTTPQLREKTLYMTATTLLSQWETNPLIETIAIHPPPSVAGKPQLIEFWQSKEIQKFILEVEKSLTELNLAEVEARRGGYTYRLEYLLEYELFDFGKNSRRTAFASVMTKIKSDYQSQIDNIIATLSKESPKSKYIDDLLFSSYFLSGDTKYLLRILELYPNSNRTSEAKFLLEQSKRSFPKKS